MSIFDIEEEKNEHRDRAKGIMAFGKQVSMEILRLYEMGREMMWGVPNYKVEDAQKVLDEIEKLKAGASIGVFQHHGALGTFLASIGLIKQEDVQSPVSWQPVPTNTGYKIQLTGDRYPTEPIPEEEQLDEQNGGNPINSDDSSINI